MSLATIQLRSLVRDVETDGYGGYFGSGGNSGYYGSYGQNGGYYGNNGYLGSYGRNADSFGQNSGYNGYDRNSGYNGYGQNSGNFAASYRPVNVDEYALYDVISAPIVVMAQEDATMAQLAQQLVERVESLQKSREVAETAFRRWVKSCDEREREMKRLQEEELRRLGEAAKRREERWGNREGHRLGGTQGVTMDRTQGVKNENPSDTQGVEKEGKETPQDLSSETPSEMEETPQGTPRGTPQDVYQGLMGGNASPPWDPLDAVWDKPPYVPLVRAFRGDWRQALVACDEGRVLDRIPAGGQVWLLLAPVETATGTTRRYYDTAVAPAAAVAQAWVGEVKEKGRVELRAARERWGHSVATSLRECFAVFAQQGNLDEANKWYCPRCGKHVVARSVTRVDKLPRVLVLQLERFEYSQSLYGGCGGDKGDGDMNGDMNGDGHNDGLNDGHNDDMNGDDDHNEMNGYMNDDMKANDDMNDSDDGNKDTMNNDDDSHIDYHDNNGNHGVQNGHNDLYDDMNGAGYPKNDHMTNDDKSEDDMTGNSIHTDDGGYNGLNGDTTQNTSNENDITVVNQSTATSSNTSFNAFTNSSAYSGYSSGFSTNYTSNYSTGYSNYSSYSYGGRRKIQTLVEFPVRGLEMGPWLKEERSCVYDLTAVCNHSGSAAGGHYYCYARDENEGETKWFEYNDSGVYAMNESDLVRETAYVLFYQRREERVSSGEVVGEMERKHEEYLRAHPLPARDVFSANDSARAGRSGNYGMSVEDGATDDDRHGNDMGNSNTVKMEVCEDNNDDDLYDDVTDKERYENATKIEVYKHSDSHAYDADHLSNSDDDLYATNSQHSRPIDILFKDQSLTEQYIASKQAASESNPSQDANSEHSQVLPIDDTPSGTIQMP